MFTIEVQELKEIATEVHDLRDTLHVAQQNVAGAFGKVTEKAISAECRLRYALERITNRLAEELFGLPRTTSAIAVIPPSDPDAVFAFINNLRNGKDARLRVFEAVYDLSQRLRLQIRLNEGHWQLLHGGEVIAWTDGTKTRLDACVSLDFDKEPETSVDTRLEKLKNNHVVISGSAPERMIHRLERRLANGAFKAELAALAKMGRMEKESGDN